MAFLYKYRNSAKPTEPNLAVGRKPQANAFFSSPEKCIRLVTNAYAIVISLQAPIYISWSWVVMNHKRVYSQENSRMHFPRPE